MINYRLKILKDGKYLDAIVSFETNRTGVQLSYKLGEHVVKTEDEYPFFALIKMRIELEKEGVKLLCNGSRRDVYPSGNSITGIMAYELKIGKQAISLLNIFEATKKLNLIGTVEEQKEYREKWIMSLK